MELMRYLMVSAGDGCSGADCIEVFNACRTLAYIKRPEPPRPASWWYVPTCETCCCPGFDDPDDYTYPGDPVHPAPWYDSGDSNSEEFFGFLPSSIETTTPYTRVGGTDTSLGRVQFRKRTITIEGDIVANSCAGTEYGKQWLINVLTPGCGLSCALLDGTVYVACDDDDDHVGGQRRIHRLGLVSFEDVSDSDYDCCEGAKVRLVLEAETSWMFGAPLPIVEASALNVELGPCGCPEWVRCLPAADPCALPEDCLPTMPPPPQVSEGGCYCEPLSQFTTCLSTPVLPDWRDSVFRFEVFSGDSPLRNARIDVWRNPGGTECEGPLTDRSPIATLLIGYVPTSSTLVVDGETGTQTMCCPAGAQPADAFVAGENGGVFVDPVVTCGGETLCVCVTVDCLNTNLGATLSMDVVPRWLA